MYTLFLLARVNNGHVDDDTKKMHILLQNC